MLNVTKNPKRLTKSILVVLFYKTVISKEPHSLFFFTKRKNIEKRDVFTAINL